MKINFPWTAVDAESGFFGGNALKSGDGFDLEYFPCMVERKSDGRGQMRRENIVHFLVFRRFVGLFSEEKTVGGSVCIDTFGRRLGDCDEHAVEVFGRQAVVCVRGMRGSVPVDRGAQAPSVHEGPWGLPSCLGASEPALLVGPGLHATRCISQAHHQARGDSRHLASPLRQRQATAFIADSVVASRSPSSPQPIGILPRPAVSRRHSSFSCSSNHCTDTTTS